MAPKGDLAGPEATDLNFLENLCCAFKCEAAGVVTPARHMSGPQPLQRQGTLLIRHSFPWAFSGGGGIVQHSGSFQGRGKHLETTLVMHFGGACADRTEVFLWEESS